MQKWLCIIALAISVFVLVMFLLDLILGLAGTDNLAPFKFANMWIDIVFSVAALILGLMSFFTLRQQV